MKIRLAIAFISIFSISSARALTMTGMSCLLRLQEQPPEQSPEEIRKAKTDKFRAKITHQEPKGVDRVVMAAQKKTITLLNTITRAKRGAVSHLKTYTDIILLEQIANNFSLVPKQARYEELKAASHVEAPSEPVTDSGTTITSVPIETPSEATAPIKLSMLEEKGQNLRDAFMDVAENTRENIRDFAAVPDKIKDLFRQHAQALLDLSVLQAELDNPERANDDPKFERKVSMPRWDFENDTPTTQGSLEENYSRNEIERQIRSLKTSDLPSLEKELGDLIHRHTRWLQTLELRRDALRDFGRSLRAKSAHTNEHDIPQLADTLVEEINTTLKSPTIDIAGVEFDPSKASPAAGRAYRNKVIADHLAKISGGILQFKTKAVAKLSDINRRVEALKKLDPLMAAQIQKSVSAQVLQIASTGVGTLIRTVGATSLLGGAGFLGLAATKPAATAPADPLETLEKECIELARANSPDFKACIEKYTRELVKAKTPEQATNNQLTPAEYGKLREEIANATAPAVSKSMAKFRAAKLQGTEAAKLAQQIFADMDELEKEVKKVEQSIEAADKGKVGATPKAKE